MQSTNSNIETKEFNELVAKYGGVVNKVCYFYATDVDDFKDLRQEALLHIWRGMSSFVTQGNTSTWIYRVALNSCISYFRRNKRSRNSEPIENHPEIISVDDEKNQLIRDLYALINLLDQMDKAIILMWLDGQDYESIGEVVGMNKTTVGTRIHRIKDKLIAISKK